MTSLPRREPSNDVSPAAALRHLSTGFWISQAIAVAADLGIADQLKHGAKTCAELAQAVGADPGALYRLLRGTASVGVFAEGEPGRFTLTPLPAGRTRLDIESHFRVTSSFNGYAVAVAEFLGRDFVDGLLALYKRRAETPA